MRLPRLELPDGAVLLYEHVPDGPDRSGGFRFAVCGDGRFLHANNRELLVDAARLDGDDPALFWSRELEEVTRFDQAGLASIRAALRAVGSLPPVVRRARPGHVSEPTVERFTIALEDVERSIVVAGEEDRPPALARVLEAVERAAPTT